MHIQASSPLPYIYSLGLVIAGFIALARYRSVFAKASHLEPSEGTFPDFLLFVWGLTVAFYLSVYAAKSLSFGLEKMGVQADTRLNPLLSTSLLELSVGVFLLLSFKYQKAFWSPKVHFSPRAWIPLLKTVGLSFLALFPFLCLCNFIWQLVLSLLVHLNWIQGLEAQSIIEAFLESPSRLHTFLLSLNAIVIAPFLEELIFRGGVYRFLKAKLSNHSSSLLSAFLFAALHGNISSFAPLWLLGCWLNTLYEKTNAIWAPTLLHSLFNANSLLLLYLSNAKGGV
jgi:membrane protease YdiL (CAAX protease family)